MKLQVIRQRNLWWALSSALILAGLAGMFISWQQFGAPLRPSLDFVGGTRLQFELDCSKPGACDQPVDVAIVREILATEGQANSSIQAITDRTGKPVGVTIRTAPLTGEERTKLQTALSQKIGDFDPTKTQIDTVGPVVGQQLFTSGLLALLVSFAGIIVYMSLRFQLDYAIFAIVALFHDILITTGVFSILGLLFGVEADSLFIVALLTIVGFSVNDTVVIYDRIRETITLNPRSPHRRYCRCRRQPNLGTLHQHHANRIAHSLFNLLFWRRNPQKLCPCPDHRFHHGRLFQHLYCQHVISPVARKNGASVLTQSQLR